MPSTHPRRFRPGPLIALSCAWLVVVACGRKEEAPAAVTADMMAMTALEGSLNILAPPGHVERGETDSQFDWVSGFEAETGCKVTVTTAGSAQEMLALVPHGAARPSPPGDASWPPPGNAPHDVVIATGDIAGELVRTGAVFTIDVARVPSYQSIVAPLQQAGWHHVGGQHYGVPFQWAPNVLLYDAQVFKKPPQSWSVTFEQQKLPDGKSNQGRVQAYAGAIYIADAALFLKSKQPSLGIQDPFELNEAQYKAALDLLTSQRTLVQRYWQDANAQVRDFINEGIVASGSWPFQANTLLANRMKVATTIPAEGATGWGAATMLVMGAQHPNCAYKWFEWSLSPKVQGDVAAFNGTNPVVPKACENNALLGAEGCRTSGIDMLEKVAFWRTPVENCASQPAGCVPFARWTSDYLALKDPD